MKKQSKKRKSKTETNQNESQNDFEVLKKAVVESQPEKTAKQSYLGVIDSSLGSKVISLPLVDVCYIAAQSPYGIVFFKNGTNRNIRFTKKDLRAILDPGHFAEIFGGRFYSLAIIAGIEGAKRDARIILKPGTRQDLPLEISRRYFDAFYKAYSLYVVNNQ